MQSRAQSNHTISFSGSSTDFNALERKSAGNTDYYITFDQTNLYIGAFKTSGNFAADDNLTIYIDTDPQVSANTGNGTLTGMTYNGVRATLPFKADYNIYAEQSAQQANKYSGSWTTILGLVYATGVNYREVNIPFASLSNPYALNITMWMGNAGSIYSNAPGPNLASSTTPGIINYFGTFGIRNGSQGNVNPVNVVSSPATGYLAGATSIAGGMYAYIDITANATINGLTLAPGGVINVNAGKSLTSSGTINNTTIANNTKSTQINISGTYTLTGRANCSYFNVNNGGTYNHNSAGSVPNGAASDWPGIDSRTYGDTSNVNILQWAQSTGTAVVGIPAPTSGGWGNVTFNINQRFNSNWPQKGAFNNIAGNLTMSNIGTNNASSNYFSFNPQMPNATINIGRDFVLNLQNGNNGIILCQGDNINYVSTHTMNVHGNFLVGGGGHLKFGYHKTNAIINYWGNYSQSGCELKSGANGGVKITINAYGINRTISATGGSFNTNDINWVITKDAVINLASDMYFWGDDYSSPSNATIEVYGRLNCNGYVMTDEYVSTNFLGIPRGSLHGNGTFKLADSATLGIGSGYGITESGSGLDIIIAIPPWKPTAKYGNIQISDRTFSTKANYVYNGSSNQVTGSGLPATVNSLTINNTGTSNNTVSLTNDVYITSYHEIDKGIFSLGSKNVILHSGPDTTASFHKFGFGAMINYGGSGRYIVERYINSGSGMGQHDKSWQLLSTPAEGETIKNTWQEGGSTSIAGYGTWITDPSFPANGFDAYSPTTSIKTYNPLTDGWLGISSTDNLIANPNGYFLFVRGDRFARDITSPATPTTLRIKGKLIIGDQSVSVPANSWQSVGNPYASSVNFQNVYNLSSNINNTFYVWDPSLNGTYGVGGYQTISGATGFIATPGGSDIYKSSTDYRDIQSGQAIFVNNSTAANGTVKFTEDCKGTGSRLVNRGEGTSAQKQLLFTNLYTSSGVLADGNTVVFDDLYSDKIDKYDAFKISNAGENFGIIRNNKILAVEARPSVTIADTIFYDMHNLKRQGYQFLLVPQNMQQALNAFLIDRYLKTEQQVSLTDSTSIGFQVTSDAGSSAANRFMLVFRAAAGPLAVSFVSVNAYKNNSFVTVEWKTENESNMEKYEVEQSFDGIHFSLIGTASALNDSKNTYDYLDKYPAPGNNYYRIRSIEKDGKSTYSPIVVLRMENMKSSFSVYPNPVKNGKINLQFLNQQKGTYHLRLLNSLGETLLIKEINYTGSEMVQQIRFDKYAPPGVYRLEIIIPNGERKVINLTK